MMAVDEPHESDFALLDLFRSEVSMYAQIIEKGLQILETSSEPEQQLEPILQSLHAIWGGACIVELSMVANLTQALKTYIKHLESDNLSLTAQFSQFLNQAIDLLTQLANTPSEKLIHWLEQKQAEFQQLTQQIESDLNLSTLTVKSFSKSAQTQTNSIAHTDDSLFGLFQTELETNICILNEGLLALEEDGTATDKLEALMRAAHSIKGAGRVVNLTPAINLAHIMEDCFVAAQQEKIHFESAQIDVLLKSVDMLGDISQASVQGTLNQLEENVNHLISALNQLLQGNNIDISQSTPTITSPPIAEKINQPKPSLQQMHNNRTIDKDRMVRVTATKIEKLMGLAGEVVVGTRWLPPFAQSLLEMKHAQSKLAHLLEKTQELLTHNTTDQVEAIELIKKARKYTKKNSLFFIDRLNELEVFIGNAATHSDRLYHEVIGVRMRPFSDGIQGYPRMVRDLAKTLGKKVKFEIIGQSTDVDQDVQEKLEAPLNHLLRNALDHGIEMPEERQMVGKPETGLLRLDVGHRSGMLMITVSDDGRGMDLALLRQKILQKNLASEEMIAQLSEAELMEFLFLPGFSTAQAVTEISGRGVGLDVVHTMVHDIGGIVRAVSQPGKGLSFHLELPLTLSVIRTFLVEIAEESYAFPLTKIDRCLQISGADIDTIEDRQYFRFGETNIALVEIHNVLDIEVPKKFQDELAVVVVSDRLNFYGLVVDKFLGESDLVVRPLDQRLGKVPNISATAVMLDGSPIIIFDVEDLVRSIDNLLSGQRLNKVPESIVQQAHKRVLVVDDSITVREMERKLLENHGYEAEVAVDGMDGWNALRSGKFDLVITDIDMPRMNGVELIQHIKQHENLKQLPLIVISYKDSQEHRLMGLEAGANFYLTKSSFEDDSFIEAVSDLIGEAVA